MDKKDRKYLLSKQFPSGLAFNKQTILSYKVKAYSFFLIFLVSFVLASCATTSKQIASCAIPGEAYAEPEYHYKVAPKKEYRLELYSHDKYYPARRCAENLYPNLLFQSKQTNAYKPGFKVYSHDILCQSEIEVMFSFNSRTESRFLKTLYLDENRITTNTINALRDVVSDKCEELPDRIRLLGTMNDREKPSHCCVGYDVTVDDFINNSFMTKNAAVGFGKSGIFETPFGQKIVYRGTIFAKGLDNPELFDDKPEERKQFIDAELVRIERENQRYRLERQKQEYLVQTYTEIFTAIVAGYIEGVSYEFGDEGFCSFLTTASQIINERVPRGEYAKCHNYLNNLLDEVKARRPLAYVISNMIGMMKTDLSDSLGESETRVGEALRRGGTACAEGILMEIGALRIGEKIDQKTLEDACLFGAALEGGTGFMQGADIKGKKK